MVGGGGWFSPPCQVCQILCFWARKMNFILKWVQRQFLVVWDRFLPLCNTFGSIMTRLKITFRRGADSALPLNHFTASWNKHHITWPSCIFWPSRLLNNITVSFQWFSLSMKVFKQILVGEIWWSVLGGADSATSPQQFRITSNGSNITMSVVNFLTILIINSIVGPFHLFSGSKGVIEHI